METPSLRRLSHSSRTLLGTALLLCLSGCQAATSPASKPTDHDKAPAPVTAQLALPSPALARLSSDGKASIADVVERVLPSVVSVATTRKAPERPATGGRQDPMFRHFFGVPNGPAPEQKQQGLGSGVVVGSGLVATNHHVVEDATEIEVHSNDGRSFVAEVVGTDPKSDLALLRLKAPSGSTPAKAGEPEFGLRPLAFGDSSRLRLGDVVLAIGNPFGVGQTVTMGIVSAKGRSDLGIVDYEDFIQTDAAVNPGNSGGALVDMEGNLVGINTAILSRTGGNQGIGFAIPSQMARPIVESLLSQGKVVRGWLGVALQPLEPELASGLGLDGVRGALVSDVLRDGPAAKAGILAGDVVTQVNQTPVTTSGELRNAIASAGAQKKTTLTIRRGAQTLNLTVALGTQPTSQAEHSTTNKEIEDMTRRIGVAVEPLSPNLREQLRLGPEVTSGVVIMALEPRGEAARAGLQRGDLVLELARERIASAADFERIWKINRGSLVARLYRHSNLSYVLLKR